MKLGGRSLLIEAVNVLELTVKNYINIKKVGYVL